MMKFLLVSAAAAAVFCFNVCAAFPAGDVPFLNIKISRPDIGTFGTSVSKQKVELEEDGKVTYEPYYPHVPPFLAFKKNPAAAYKPQPPPPPSPVYDVQAPVDPAPAEEEEEA